jgi:hypothetical protein
MSEKKFSKIHQKVADVLGMQIPDEVVGESEAGMVAVPEANEVTVIENAELPDLQQEMQRIEHGQRQTEFLYEHGLVAVQTILLDVPLTPPMYRGRVVESAAELYKAVAALGMHKVEYQIKLAELKLKLAAYTRRKNGDTTPNITGNTIIFNREELIKAFGNDKDDDKGEV